jgi:hypothetical protein
MIKRLSERPEGMYAILLLEGGGIIPIDSNQVHQPPPAHLNSDFGR